MEILQKSNIWVTSDFHFGHNKEFIWKARGFNSIEEMNETLVSHFNARVDANDDVYILGDLVLGETANIEYIKRLNSKLHIVVGNHDTTTRQQLYAQLPNVVEIKNAIYLDYCKHHFYLSHYPTLTSNNDYDKPLCQRLLNLCGHTHTTMRWKDSTVGYIYHCEVDAHECYPINLDFIIQEFKNRHTK